MNTLTEQGSWSHSTNNTQHEIAVYSAMRCLYSHHDSHYYFLSTWILLFVVWGVFFLPHILQVWWQCTVLCANKDVIWRGCSKVYWDQKGCGSTCLSWKETEILQTSWGKTMFFVARTIIFPGFAKKIHKCELIILSKANMRWYLNARSKMSSVFRTRCKSQC